jgi:hypothetical protein
MLRRERKAAAVRVSIRVGRGNAVGEPCGTLSSFPRLSLFLLLPSLSVFLSLPVLFFCTQWLNDSTVLFVPVCLFFFPGCRRASGGMQASLKPGRLRYHLHITTTDRCLQHHQALPPPPPVAIASTATTTTTTDHCLIHNHRPLPIPPPPPPQQVPSPLPTAAATNLTAAHHMPL